MKTLEIEHRLKDLVISLNRHQRNTTDENAPSLAVSLSAFMKAEHIKDRDLAENQLADLARRMNFVIDDSDDDTDRIVFKWCPGFCHIKATVHP